MSPTVAATPPQKLPRKLQELLEQHVVLASPGVSNFLDGVILYVLSREWHDAFATNFLHLHPLPYCSEDGSELPCTMEATSSEQLHFAAAMLLGASVLQRVAEGGDECGRGCEAHLFKSEGKWRSLVPPMVGMCVGWALGYASVQWLAELDSSEATFQAHPGLANLALSAIATVATAVLILVCQPSTLGLACGVLPRGDDGVPWPRCAHLLRELESVWRLSARALSVVVMMLWNRALGAILVEGVAQEDQQGPMYLRMLLFWAVALTTAGSLVSLRVIRLRAQLIDQLRDAAQPAASPPQLLRERVNWTALLAHALALLEQTVGYVIGSAWTQLVLACTSLASFPTLAVTTKDMLVALGLSLLAVGWLFLNRQTEADVIAPSPGQALRGSYAGEVERERVELFYLTNAFSFFVGWAWVSFLRDLQTLAARLGASNAVWSYLSEALCVIAFGPGLTWLLLRGHQRWGGRDVWHALLAQVGIEEVYAPETRLPLDAAEEGESASSAATGAGRGCGPAAAPRGPRDRVAARKSGARVLEF